MLTPVFKGDVHPPADHLPRPRLKYPGNEGRQQTAKPCGQCRDSKPRPKPEEIGAAEGQRLSRATERRKQHAGGKIGSIYGVYDADDGVDVRGRFIIDPDGVIQAIEILTPPVGRKVGESIRQLQAFQHVRETKGAEVCPAGWTPGSATLKVSPDLAGNVWKVWRPNE